MSSIVTVQASALFELGQLFITPGAQHVIDGAGGRVTDLLARHQSGDWGEVDPEDAEANSDALRHGWRVLSAYPVGSHRVWIITEADRSSTTLLLPEEY